MTDPITRPYVKVVTVPSPAAGAEWTVTATEGAAWRILTADFTLTTSAAVANRTVRLVADDGMSEFFRTRALTAQAATLGVVYCASPGSSGGSTQAASQLLIWPSMGLLLPRGHRLRSLTDLIDVADQYSAIALLVEIFPEGSGIRWAPGPAPYASEEF